MTKEKNDRLYQQLMESRRCDPKHFGLAAIGVAYEDVMHYSNSKKVVLEELQYLKEKCLKRMGEVVSRYSLTEADVREYFARNRYSLSFLQESCAL